MKGAKDGKLENAKAETNGSCVRHSIVKGRSEVA